MPETSLKMALGLGSTEKEFSRQNLIDHSSWGLTSPGGKINLGHSLFPRLEKKTKQKGQNVQKKKKPSPKSENADRDAGLITFDDFKKLDLRVAEIKTAEKIKKSDRLLKLTVLAPEERTLVAGIAEYYNPKT